MGNPDALLVLVEYGDYECPFCGMAYPVIKDIQQRLRTALRFVFRNFPLSSIHPNAFSAAVAAEAAALQGRFWAIEADFESGIRSGVNGTPAFFINGKKYEGKWADGQILQYLKMAEPGPRVITSFHEQNTTQGSEFLDDAIRTKDQPLKYNVARIRKKDPRSFL